MKKFILAAVVLTFMIAPSLAWFDTGYPFRAVERINYTGSTPLYNFTYPVNSTKFNFGGIDTGDQTVWVKIPVLNPGINSQFLYYNDNYNYTSVATNDLTQNGMEVDIGNSSNISSAWDSSYSTVWHMTENGGDGFGNFLMQDSVSGNHVYNSLGVFPFDIFGSPVGNSAFFGNTINGVVYGFLHFETFPNTSPFTLEALVKFNSLNSENPIINADQPDGHLSYELYYGGTPGYCNTTNQFAFAINSLNNPGTITCATGTIPGGIQTDVWYYLAASYDGSSTIKLYINGALINSSSYTEVYWFPASNWNLGYNDNTANLLDGYIDEASTSIIPRSDDWILARNASLMGRFSTLNQQQGLPSLNLTLTSPSGNYNTTSLPINLNISFTTQGQLNTSSCYYQRDGGTQTAIPSCSTLAFSESAAGNHTIFVSASSLDGATANATSAYSVTVNAAPPSPATGKVTGASASILLIIPILLALLGLLQIIRNTKSGKFMNSFIIGIVTIIVATIIFAILTSVV